MAVPITNGNSLGLDQNPGTLPNVIDALFDWFQTITFTIIVKTVVNFELVETPTDTTFLGIVERPTPQQLAILPEGERKWNWINVWVMPNLVLNIDDRFVYKSIKYRVMSKNDWVEYGYVEYSCCQDYE